MKICNSVISLPGFSTRLKYTWLLLSLFALTLKSKAQNPSISDSIATITTNIRPQQLISQVKLSSLHFIKAIDNRINFGLAGSEFKYIVLKLNSSSVLSDQYLSIDNTSPDTVSIYKIYGDGKGRLLYFGGSLVTFDSKRNYVWHTTGVEISKIPSYYLIALKTSQENINVRYEILSRDELQHKYQEYESLVFFYLGIVSIITAIVLVVFLLFRKPVFAAYLGYIVCLSAWIFSHYGRIFPFVYPNFPLINEIAKPLSSLGTSLFLIIILQSVFHQQLKARRWLQQILRWMLYLLMTLTCLMPFLLITGLNAWFMLALLVCWHAVLIISAPVIMFTAFYFINSGFIARIFSAAMLIVCVMGLVQLFGNLGFINNYFINEHGMAIGSLLEISLMAYGLFYSLLEERKQKEEQVLSLQNEQTETLKKLITVQDNERKRIAADLHDNIGPLLAALKINFRRIIHAKEEPEDALVIKTETIIDDSIAEIRNVAHNLMPKSLSSNGLINTLNEYFNNIQQLHKKIIVFDHNIHSILNPELQINVYRIICELVLNAARHSNARLITVLITADVQIISIIINDDGQGFQSKHGVHKKSLGLQNAESRVLYLKGKFELKTNPGEGTSINMAIPLQFYEAKVDSL